MERDPPRLRPISDYVDQGVDWIEAVVLFECPRCGKGFEIPYGWKGSEWPETSLACSCSDDSQQVFGRAVVG
jgi:hypothetical protein